MKNKFAYKRNLIYYEEECIEYLENMSKKGWQLKSCNSFFFHFIPCNQPLKYQFDYNQIDNEYLEILNEQGYEHIACKHPFHIYKNKDLNVIDLQTDNAARKIALLDYYSSKPILAQLCFAIVFAAAGIYSLSQYLGHHTAILYLYFTNILLSILSILVSITLVLEIYINNLKRKSINDETYSFHKFYPIDKKFEIFSNIEVLLLFIPILNTSISKFSSFQYLFGFVLIVLLPSALHSIEDSYIKKYSSTLKRGVLTATAFIIYMSLYLGVFYTFIVSLPVKEPPLPINNAHYEIKSNVFVYAIDAYPHQKYYQCLNSNVTKSFFEYEIIDTQFITEHPYHDQDLLEKHKIKNWDNHDTFELAIQKYTKVNSQYFEECYTNSKYIVAKKDKTVIRIEKDENTTINEQLKKFINI